MQSLQSNCEASSQTFLSIPPRCTREMLRKSPNCLGTIDGLSYQEYFENPSNTVLIASPRRLGKFASKPEEIIYKVSSVFDLDEATKLELSEEDSSEEPENCPPENSPCEKKENEGIPMYSGEGHTPSKIYDTHEISRRTSSGSQGDAARNEGSKDTLLENSVETRNVDILPTLSKDNTRVLTSERVMSSGSENSIVSSIKVEVGSQETIPISGANSYDLVSFIGASVVSKPLMQAQSEGKCKKKKKNSKSLKGVSKSVPHVVPEEVQKANDFSRVIAQEGIYTEMSSGDDAFSANLDQYLDDEDSLYSSESDDDDDSLVASHESDESAIEISSTRSYQAPMAPPVSIVTSPDDSASILSNELDGQCSNNENALQNEADSTEETAKSIETDTRHPTCSTSTPSSGRSGSPTNPLEYSKEYILSKSNESVNSPSSQSIISGFTSQCGSNSNIDERERRSKRLEKLVEKLCQDFVAQNPSLKQNPATLVSYFENAGTVIRALPITDLKCGIKNIQKDPATDSTNDSVSHGSSETSQATSQENIKAQSK